MMFLVRIAMVVCVIKKKDSEVTWRLFFKGSDMLNTIYKRSNE